VAKAQNLFCIAVIGITLYFNLAALLNTLVSVSAPLQPIELQANFKILCILAQYKENQNVSRTSPIRLCVDQVNALKS
jgi:hypothetical protein